MRMKKRLVSMVGGLALLIVTVAGCGEGGTGGAGSDDDYRVVVLGGLSTDGVLADNARTSVLAAKAGAEWVNNNGGMADRKVTVEVIDDQGDPTVAVTKLREKIAEGKPDLVLNSGPSTVADATMPILTQNRILSFNIAPTASSADPATSPLNFDLSPSPADQVKSFAPYFEQRGYRSVGIMHGSSSYGETFGATSEAVLEEAGMDVVANEEYDIAALDMTAQLSAIRAEDPDVVVLDAYGAPLGYVLKGIQKLGWDVPVVGNTSVSATTLVSTPPPSGVLDTPAVENLAMQVLRSAKYDPDAKLTNEAVATMKSLGDIKSTLFVAYNYDALVLAQAAVEDAGSTDAEKVAEALTEPEVQKVAKTAIVSRYNFTTKSHAPNSEDAEFIFIPPAKLRDGQFH